MKHQYSSLRSGYLSKTQHQIKPVLANGFNSMPRGFFIFFNHSAGSAAMDVSTRSDSHSKLKKTWPFSDAPGLTHLLFFPNQTFGPKFHLNPSPCIYPKKSKQTPSNTLVFCLFFETHRHPKKRGPKRLPKQREALLRASDNFSCIASSRPRQVVKFPRNTEHENQMHPQRLHSGRLT